jgi:thiol-disulfide isomerase/thioredoxin
MVGRPFIASLDMYRKVPVDLLEGTRRGSILSTVAVVSMATLFFLETKAFLSSSLKTSLALDGNTDPQVRVNFNITMMDLKCDFATIDVVSVLGTQQNVTQHVQKFPIDQYGVRQRYQQRNRQQHDVQLFDATIEETIEELHENGEHAQSLDADLLDEVLEYNTYAFIDFFANWCSHCRDLAPTWETLAEVMHQVAEERVESAHEAKHGHREHHYSDEDYAEAVAVELPVFIGKIDCVEHQELCMQRSIRAYPTLKFFVDGVEKGDYLGHRTVVELAHFIESMELEHKGKDAKDDLKSSDVKNGELLWCHIVRKFRLCRGGVHFLRRHVGYTISLDATMLAASSSQQVTMRRALFIPSTNVNASRLGVATNGRTPRLRPIP